MKKVAGLFKRIFLIIGTFLISVYTKVQAAEPLSALHGIGPVLPSTEVSTLYGVPKSTKISMFLNILMLLTVPLVFIIGIIIYIKKSSSSKVKKIITAFIAFIIGVLACLGINYIIYK